MRRERSETDQNDGFWAFRAVASGRLPSNFPDVFPVSRELGQTELAHNSAACAGSEWNKKGSLDSNQQTMVRTVVLGPTLHREDAEKDSHTGELDAY